MAPMHLLSSAVLATLLIVGVTCMATGVSAASRSNMMGGEALAKTKLSNAATITALCSTTNLVCADNDDLTTEFDVAKAASLRDMSINTINEIQRDFFLESALVAGGMMSLDQNLRDPAPKRAFLTSSAAHSLPSLAPANALALMKRFGVAHDSAMATAVATAAYLCGSAALPGEARTCAASTDAMAAFVAAELGRNVKVFATSGAPTSAAAVRAPVTIVDVAKGSAAEGEKIVVCHHIAFPSELFYCHRVTGTIVVKATLAPQGHGSAPIKAVGICHINTSMWLSTHPAFAALNIPRGDEACHWLVANDIVFVPAMSPMVA